MARKSVKNKVIHSFSEVDLTAIAIPSIAIAVRFSRRTEKRE